MASTWVRIRDRFVDLVSRIVVPVASILSLAVPGLPAGVAVILRAIPVLMSVAEQIHPESGSGAKKSEFVHVAAEAMLTAVGVTVTGGAAETYAKIKPTIQAIIDNGVALVNDDQAKQGV